MEILNYKLSSSEEEIYLSQTSLDRYSIRQTVAKFKETSNDQKYVSIKSSADLHGGRENK